MKQTLYIAWPWAFRVSLIVLALIPFLVIGAAIAVDLVRF
jgi:hypothetical protein